MIRNVVVARVRPGAAAEDVETAVEAMRALEVEGCLGVEAGVDAGLREGNWSLAITADFADLESYRRYDTDEEHNRIRRDLFAPIVEEIVRVQFEV